MPHNKLESANTIMRLGVKNSARTALVVCGAVIGLLVVACTTPTTTTTGAKNDTFFSILSGFEVRTANTTSADVGTCGQLAGTPANPTFERLDCSNFKANYRIMQVANTPNECVQDVDRRYYRNFQGREYTACLDYNWDEQTCISMITPIPQKVACADKSADKREKATKILTSATDTSGCPSGGYTHTVRRFTVCTETQE
ncbi:LppU/SCO3897 family protein [Mycobacteroides abscessus]